MTTTPKLKTIAEVAAEFGVTRQAIDKLMAKHGIEPEYLNARMRVLSLKQYRQLQRLRAGK